MKTKIKIPAEFIFILIAMLSIFTITRAGLLIYTGTEDLPLKLWPAVMLKGFLFDMPVILFAAGFLLFFTALTPKNWALTKKKKVFKLVFLWGVLYLLFFISIAETVFWAEFYTRFNFIAVEYLIYTNEVIGNIVQSYPVGRIFSGLAILTAAIVWALRHKLNNEMNLPRFSRLIMMILFLALTSISYQVSNADAMTGLGNSYADELSGNGIMTFFAALRRNDLQYDKLYLTIPQEEADSLLKSLDMERAPLSQTLKKNMFDPADDYYPFKKRPKNIVILMVESLSASFLNSYGADENLTPNLDAIAAKGLKFERFFATGTRTVRGLEAFSLGIPPIPGQSIIHRPNIENLSTLGGILRKQGYAALFIYGGYGYFDNMNYYFKNNNYLIFDRTDFSKETISEENIWGVDDEALFTNAIAAIDKEINSGKPFLAHIMTTSNHRPFTYPQGRIDIPSPGGRRGAVKYSDYAIGSFFKKASQKKWFKETLFIITADHCASVAGKTKLTASKYRIPLIFYAPDIMPAGVNKNIISQLDMPPTIIEILGKKGDDYFFGRSIFEESANPQRAFISNYQSLGYLKKDILTILSPKRKVEAYRVNIENGNQIPIKPDPDLTREAIAYYQTSDKTFRYEKMSFK